MTQVLIVDDDNEIRRLVSGYLERHDMHCRTARDGEEMRRELATNAVDVVLLDIMLPGEDGLALCRWLRRETQIPVIMVTALAEESDRVLGLEIGADDYLTKPFSTRELLARIRAVLRRAPQQLAVHKHAGNERYAFAGWLLDVNKRRLTNPHGALVELTGGAYDLLLAFARRPGEVLSRDQLLEVTKGRKPDPYDRSVDVQLSRLRRQLNDAELIKTVRGGGYLLAAAVQQLPDE